MHIHLDNRWRGPTRIRRCIIDTGSDINLVTQRTLDALKLPYSLDGEDPVYGISGAPLLPIGSTVLTWHMDRHETIYAQRFLIISDEAAVTFDVLLGKPWINMTGAVRPNLNVMLTQRPGLHPSP